MVWRRLLLILCLSGTITCTYGRSALEQTVALRLSGGVQHFLLTNSNIWPTQWNELGPAVQDCNNLLLASGQHQVQALFIFFPLEFPAMDLPNGKIILGRYESIRAHGLKGRYVIYETPEHEVGVTWLSDADFKYMLTAYRKKLPEPIQWSDIVKERSRRNLFLACMLFVLATGVIGFKLFKNIRKEKGPLLGSPP